MDELVRKRGRPIKRDARRNIVKVALDDYELDVLNKVCNCEGLSRSEIIRKAIEMFVDYKVNNRGVDYDDYYYEDNFDYYEDNC